MAAPSKLSQTTVGIAWLGQFPPSDRPQAAAMLDAMLLLNEEQIISSLRMSLDRIARGARHRGKRVALYAEREYQESTIFPVSLVPDANGKLRRRSVGRTGPAAVKPVRGKARVGSEGIVAFVISQQKEAWPKIFMNQPGPDGIRGKTSPAGEIVIVSDFLGSGSRLRSMLDKFWAVPTVRSWISQRLIKFRIVAAAATAPAIANLKRHKTHPEVITDWIAPTVISHPNWSMSWKWKTLINTHGPQRGRGTGRFGFGDEGALIALSYRIPNNAPAIVHHSQGGWRALYDGPVPVELYRLFGVRSLAEMIETAAEDSGVDLGEGLTEEDRLTIVVLSLLKGRWHKGAEIALASRTGLTVPRLMDVLRGALKNELITGTGRLTDKGYAFVQSGRALERATPQIATNPKPYYPESLRVPG
jgi:hypothetical protein